MFVRLFVGLFVCLIVELFVCLLVYLFVCLFACLFVCLFVGLFCVFVCRRVNPPKPGPKPGDPHEGSCGEEGGAGGRRNPCKKGTLKGSKEN